MPKYVIDVLSSFRNRFVVEAKCEEDATDEVVMQMSDSEFQEFSQLFLGDNLISCRELRDDSEYFALFAKDNDYLASFSHEQMLEFVNHINYEDV